MKSKLTHLDESGRAKMVDVGNKPVSARRAVAEGFKLKPSLPITIGKVFHEGGLTRRRTNVLKESQRDSLYGTAATPYREQSPVTPRSKVGDAPGDSDSLKRYRRFFETHDLHGLPQRDSETNR